MLNPRRLTKPQVRRPGATDWQDTSWNYALNEIARWTMKTRDNSFVWIHRAESAGFHIDDTAEVCNKRMCVLSNRPRMSLAEN
jgi:anaerobic selenocysteine-containing dehydrogenase